MKKMFLLVIILLPVLFSSCKSEEAKTKTVMIAFFKALSNKNIEAARKLTTTDSKQMMDFLENIITKSATEADKFDKANLDIDEPRITGNKASIAVTEKTTGETLNYILKKENGSWKMSFDEESLMNMGVDKMNEKAIDPAQLEEQFRDINMDSLKHEIDKGSKAIDSIKKELK
ncbi:hypothetical protein BH11BAC4_BH11BAC4_09100 [soil metagenome]